MAQVRAFSSARRPRQSDPPRARNLRTGWILMGAFLAMFVGSVIYIIVYHAAAS